MEKKSAKKNPCPDCTFCQFCNNARCNMCRTQPKKKTGEKRKPHKPLFLKF